MREEGSPEGKHAEIQVWENPAQIQVLILDLESCTFRAYLSLDSGPEETNVEAMHFTCQALLRSDLSLTELLSELSYCCGVRNEGSQAWQRRGIIKSDC